MLQAHWHAIISPLRKSVPLSLGILILSACTNLTSPDYQTPSLPSKSAWTLNGTTARDSLADIPIEWWDTFNDPQLSALMRQALAQNIDLNLLVLRIDAASVGLSETELTNVPTVSLGTSASASRAQGASTSRSYASNLSGLSWEIDLWGKLRQRLRAEKANYLATEADYRAGHLTLAANVASTYFTIRRIDRQQQAQRQTLRRNERILAIYRSQLREGLVDRGKLMRQDIQRRALQRELLDLERQRVVLLNRLATLLGEPAGNVELTDTTSFPSATLPRVPSGLPSDLLARRPDVLAAEFRVLKAHEMLGVARLNRLPTIKLNLAVGLQASALSSLMQSLSGSAGSGMDWALFDPRHALRVESSTIEHKVSEQQYRMAVLNAFEEVENALINLANRRKQLDQLRIELSELRQISRQTLLQLQGGLISQLEVLDAEATLHASEQALLALHYQAIDDTIALYKALGGGWPKQSVTHYAAAATTSIPKE